jgi:predicted ester cyclase
MPAASSKALVKKLAAAVNAGDATALQGMFPAADKADVKRHSAAAKSALPDLKLTIDDTIAEGDKIAIRWTARATHKGEHAHARLGKVKGTGRPMAVTGITILHVEGGKIVEAWGETGELDALEQLNMLPAKK